jgi:hypothetical protein
VLCFQCCLVQLAAAASRLPASRDKTRCSLESANRVPCRAERPLHLEPPRYAAEHRIPGDGAIGLERVRRSALNYSTPTELCSNHIHKHTHIMATTRVAMTAQSSLRSVASRPFCTPIPSPMGISYILANEYSQASHPPLDPSPSLLPPHNRRAPSHRPPEPSTGWHPKPANRANRAKADLACPPAAVCAAQP